MFTIPGTVRDELRGARWSGVPNRLSSDHHLVARHRRGSHRNGEALAALARRSGLRSSSRTAPSRSATRRSRFAASSTSGAAQSHSMAIRGSHATPSTRSCSRSCRARGRSRSPRCRGALASISCSSSTAWRTCPPASMPSCETPRAGQALERAMDRAFVWTRPAGCPASLPLFFLEEGDARRAAQQTSCDQEIAADGVFAAAMLAEYRASLEAFGPWFYRRLYWETGVIGQVLYLEAEASRHPQHRHRLLLRRPHAPGLRAHGRPLSRCSTTSPWAGRSTIHACRPIHRISTSRGPRAVRSHGSSAYQKKKGPKQITASALVALSAPRQGE